MITNFIELYGELERFKNIILDFQNKLQSGSRFTKEQLVNELISLYTEWENSGIRRLNIDLNFDKDRNLLFGLSDFNSSMHGIKYSLEEYNETGRLIKSDILFSLGNALKGIERVQQTISKYDAENLYSNELLKAQYINLFKRYKSFLSMLTPSRDNGAYEPDEIIYLDESFREDVADFINGVVDFANGLNIDVEPHAFYSLIEPLFQKQTYEHYIQQLKKVEELFDVYMVEMLERIDNMSN
jgi:hypothetical protein